MMLSKKNNEALENFSEKLEVEGRSLWQDARRRFMHNRAAVASLIVLVIIALFVTIAPMVSQFSYYDTDWGMMSSAPDMESGHYFGTDSSGRDLLVRVWLMMDLPCAKYLKAMLPTWLPMLRAHGELADYDGFAFLELERMSSATMDRYLEKTRDAARPRGTVPTRPAGELLRNSIAIRKAGDELDGLPGNVEADTVAHCGPSARGEFCRTLTVVDIATGWTENASCRNNAFVNFSKAEETIEGRMPFRIRPYDTDNGSEFINRDLIAWLQERDIEQTRSRPYRKNDQATVESRNNHIVRRHAFHYRYTVDELGLLNELWELVFVFN